MSIAKHIKSGFAGASLAGAALCVIGIAGAGIGFLAGTAAATSVGVAVMCLGLVANIGGAFGYAISKAFSDDGDKIKSPPFYFGAMLTTAAIVNAFLPIPAQDKHTNLNAKQALTMEFKDACSSLKPQIADGRATLTVPASCPQFVQFMR